jgi:hypothetical protein
MSKDLDNFGITEIGVEGIDDMMVAAGGSLVMFESLLKFFEEMIVIARVFADEKTGKISAPGGKIPIEKLSLGLKEQIDAMDGAFVETLVYCEWISELEDSRKRVSEKLENIQSGGGGERLR